MTGARPQSDISAILLASGLSRRMDGRDKLLLPYRGMTLLERAVELLDSLPVHEKILVTTQERLETITPPAGINTVVNPRPQLGQSESLRLGILEATGGSYLFLMADQPLLTFRELYRLLLFACENPGSIVYPFANGVPLNPAVFPSKFRQKLLELSGDTGGRVVRMSHPEDCLPLETKAPEVFRDIDSWDDYISLLK